MRSIHAIVLAAGASSRIGFPKALAKFGRRSALEIAVANVRAAGLPRPWVVLGHAAEFLRPYVEEAGARPVVHSGWRRGQLSSFLAGLRRVPPSASGFILYPVDLPLLRPQHLRGLVRAFEGHPNQEIFCPVYQGHGGHPVLFRGRLRKEFTRLGPKGTARDVVYRDLRRVHFVPIRTNAHRRDFDTPGSYRRLRSRFGR